MNNKKTSYLIGIGTTIILILFLVITTQDKTTLKNCKKIVKQELKNSDKVKGVFKNIYVPYKQEHHEEVFEQEVQNIIEKTAAEPEKIIVKEQGIIMMANPIYKKHKKAIVKFTHLKHIKKYSITCGECHHNKKKEPLNNIKLKDPVASCASCHQKPSQKPKGKDIPKLTHSQKLEYHAEALHLNCISCHKKFNKKTGTKKAPASCKKCHAK